LKHSYLPGSPQGPSLLEPDTETRVGGVICRVCAKFCRGDRPSSLTDVRGFPPHCRAFHGWGTPPAAKNKTWCDADAACRGGTATAGELFGDVLGRPPSRMFDPGARTLQEKHRKKRGGHEGRLRQKNPAVCCFLRFLKGGMRIPSFPARIVRRTVRRADPYVLDGYGGNAGVRTRRKAGRMAPAPSWRRAGRTPGSQRWAWKQLPRARISKKKFETTAVTGLARYGGMAIQSRLIPSQISNIVKPCDDSCFARQSFFPS